MNDKKFEWNEELVKDAVNELSKKFAYPNEHDKWEGINKELEKFKEQHTPVKDYEILSFTHGYEKYRLLDTVKKYIRYNTELSALLSHVPNNATITAVKRISDGEMFSIDDITQYGKIKGFQIREGKMVVEYEAKGDWQFLSSVEHQKEVNNPILFVSEDGVDIHEGDRIVLISTSTWITHEMTVPKGLKKHPFSGKDKAFVYLSNLDAAKEYILMNQKLLSLQDLLDNWEGLHHGGNQYKSAPMFLTFKEVAVNKINQ